jgi:hypothetical protein
MLDLTRESDVGLGVDTMGGGEDVAEHVAPLGMAGDGSAVECVPVVSSVVTDDDAAAGATAAPSSDVGGPMPIALTTSIMTSEDACAITPLSSDDAVAGASAAPSSDDDAPTTPTTPTKQIVMSVDGMKSPPAPTSASRVTPTRVNATTTTTATTTAEGNGIGSCLT